MSDHHPHASTSSLPATRFGTIDALTDRTSLQSILGPVAGIVSQPLETGGYSGSRHYRLQIQLRSGAERHLVLKLIHLERAWTAYRTGDAVGREAALLAEPQLHGIWDVFRCPYLAYAAENGELGVLMEDLSEHLLPDVDSPLTEAQEDRLLTALAAMHAHYWGSHLPQVPWLTSPERLLPVLSPAAGEEEARRGPSLPLFDLVTRGWTEAYARLTDSTIELLNRTREDLPRQCAALPRTVIHGDAKVANFALLHERGVAAFDWAWIGAGPCTLDLGWYLAVNAARLSRGKEEVIDRYRDLLQSRLGEALPDELWERLMRVGILYGAIMLLWAKALGLETGSEGATGEWNWWIDQLTVVLQDRST